MEAITSAITFVDSETGRNYTVRLAKEGATTDDWTNRFLAAPVGWREGRLAFTFSDVEGDPHAEARHVGNLFNLRHETIDGNQWVVADLDWDTDELAIEAKRLVDEDRITGVSISPSDGEGFMVCGSPPDGSTTEDIRAMAEQFDPESCPPDQWVEAWGDVVISSATLLMNPAFEDAAVVVAAGETDQQMVSYDVVMGLTAEQIADMQRQGISIVPGPYKFVQSNEGYVDDGISLQASTDLKRPPADWFTDPHLTEPTPLTITDDGRVYGHLALWNTCHRGFDNTCITPPKDHTEYAEFHDNARVMLDSGELLGVGCLTVDVSHADVRASAESAKRHYDHSGTTAAFTRAGVDEVGVWLAGAVAPWATEENIEKLRRLSLSGDWRPKGGSYFLIAAQAVPVPGFPIRARVASGIQVSLTTVGPANPVPDPLEDMSELGLVATALQMTNAKVDEVLAWIRPQMEAERRREYEAALAVLNGVATPSADPIPVGLD